MTDTLQSLDPTVLWSHFDAIRQTPRPSKHEEQIAKHVAAWAQERGFEVVMDSAGSLTVRVPASPGHADAPTIVLQGHLDMVCEKNSDVDIDFFNDPIPVVIDGDWVRTEGTTLGADNGIGVAAAMAIADDPTVVHGPLELLCTVDEETGLTGAKQLDPAIVTGRVMINLDTEEDGAVYFGCAGGSDALTTLGVTRRRGLLGSAPVRIAVQGLRGGHSGLHIHENRGNAIKMLSRVLLTVLDSGIELDLVSFDGGSKHNAIPRDAVALCRVAKAERARLDDAVARTRTAIAEEFAAAEPDMEITVIELPESRAHHHVFNLHARDRLLHMLNAMPHGVITMSRDVPGLVETSNNLAIVATEDDRVEVTTSHRSSIMSALFAVREQVRSISQQAGATMHADDAYPGWKPNPSSPVVQKTMQVYEQLFGTAPELKAIHAGLECGLILEKVPGMDAVSIGPQIENAHSPEESVQISSVKKFYEHLKALLAALA